MKASFENSVDVLVKAYMNDTLVHMACTACAVGNLVADAHGTRPLKGTYGKITFDGGRIEIDREGADDARAFVYENGRQPRWASVFSTHNHQQRIFRHQYFGLIKEEIEKTGYILEQLAAIEKAFESAPHGGSVDNWNFNGLLAVVDVLAEIHGVDLSVKQAAIGQFEEIHATK